MTAFRWSPSRSSVQPDTCSATCGSSPNEVDGARSERSRSVGRWAGLVATELGLDAATVRCAELAGELCDVGKVLLPRSIWAKPDALTTTERRIARAHAEHGYQLIKVVPGLADVADAVRQHHERWDGRGYPDGWRSTGSGSRRASSRCATRGRRWSATVRSGPRASPEQACRRTATRERGGQFDPDVVDVFLRLRERAVIGDDAVLRSAELS